MIEVGIVISLLIVIILTIAENFGSLISRHSYNQVPQVANFGLDTTITIPSSNFNALQGSVRGDLTQTGGGAANKGIIEAIALYTIRSQKYGILVQVQGPQLYYMSSIYGSVPPTTAVAAGDVANCGFEFCTPVFADIQDTIQVDIQWNPIATFASGTGLAYNGVLRLVPDVIVGMPNSATFFRWKQLGVAGVVGAAALWTDTPQVIPGTQLFGVMIEENTTAKGTYTDALDTWQIEHDRKFPFGQPLTFAHSRYITAREDGLAHIVGIEILRFLPIKNDQSTVISINNGAVATVVGSTITYWYVSDNMESAIIREEAGAMPKYAPYPIAIPDVVIGGVTTPTVYPGGLSVAKVPGQSAGGLGTSIPVAMSEDRGITQTRKGF